MSEQHDQQGATEVAPASPSPGSTAAATDPGPVAHESAATEPTSTPPVEQAPTEAAPAPAEAPAEPALKPHTDEPGLLQATPEEKAPETPEGERSTEGAPPEAVESALYELVVPENFEVVREGIEEARQVFADGKVPKETAEKLWGMHLRALQQDADRALQRQHDAFADYRREQRNLIAADPEYGGARLRTSIAEANKVLDLMARDPGGDPAKTNANIKAQNDWLMASGATDSYALFIGLQRLAKFLNEPQSGPPPNPAPLPARTAMGRAPQGARGGRSGFYDQPRGGSRS